VTEQVMARSSLIWTVPAWTLIVVVTAIGAPSTTRGIVSGCVFAVGVVGLYLTTRGSRRLRQIAVVLATLGGLGGSLLAPSGIAISITYITASRLPAVFSPRAVRVFGALETLAVASVIAIISHSWVGLLAGVGIPLLIQRAHEHEELVRSRDQARALLAEVEAGREAEERAAALRERGRIARELHDLLAHTLAGLSVQLQGIRAVAAREQVSPKVLEPLDRAADLARSGLEEARAAVGALRDPVGLGIDALSALVARHPGPPSFRMIGEGAVSPEAGHAVYRAVQEGLTNSARYAPGAAVTVTLEWSRTSLVTRIIDTGLPPGRSPVGGQSTGLGLAGMDERVREVGGSVTAGPLGAGWQVQIEVPLAEVHA
jgi:signal transduction histidine kinase